jgi:hypothetical protein
MEKKIMIKFFKSLSYQEQAEVILGSFMGAFILYLWLWVPSLIEEVTR